MKQRLLHKIISGALLVYFALFIIPPVSTIAFTSGALPALEDQVSFSQDHRHTRLYLVDILVWLKLKQSRHSETLSLVPRVSVVSAGPHLMDSAWSAILHERQELVVFTARAVPHAISGHQSRSSDIVFARSGISPPSL